MGPPIASLAVASGQAGHTKHERCCVSQDAAATTGEEERELAAPAVATDELCDPRPLSQATRRAKARQQQH